MEAGLDQKARKRILIPALKVGARYFAILLTGALILRLMPESWFAPFSKLLADALQASLNILGIPNLRAGPITILLPTPEGKILPVYIVRHCLGLHPLLSYLALVIALPAVPLAKRLWGALLGTTFLSLANVARTATTMWVGAVFGSHAFDLVHLTVWRVGLTFLALLTALAFALWVGKDRESLFAPA